MKNFVKIPTKVNGSPSHIEILVSDENITGATILSNDPRLNRGTSEAELVPISRTLQIGGTAQDLSTNRIWIWTPTKTQIEVGEIAIVPSQHQQLIFGALTNDGQIINDGNVIFI